MFGQRYGPLYGHPLLTFRSRAGLLDFLEEASKEVDGRGSLAREARCGQLAFRRHYLKVGYQAAVRAAERVLQPRELASKFPWLEHAFSRAYCGLVPHSEIVSSEGKLATPG